MQLIFKYDLERLNSYSLNTENNIKIANSDDYIMMSFPEVDYFNYTFNNTDRPFQKEDIKRVNEFYTEGGIEKHKVLVAAACEASNKTLRKESGYKQVLSIAKMIMAPDASVVSAPVPGLSFLKASHGNIDVFTQLYLDSFEAVGRDQARVANNFKNLLGIKNLDLFLLKQGEDFVGVNVLYKTPEKSLLAGGAILPKYRNRGFHRSGLSFRIQQSLMHNNSGSIVAWAYNPSISLRNMQKMNMEISEEFNVYEFDMKRPGV